VVEELALVEKRLECATLDAVDAYEDRAAIQMELECLLEGELGRACAARKANCDQVAISVVARFGVGAKVSLLLIKRVAVGAAKVVKVEINEIDQLNAIEKNFWTVRYVVVRLRRRRIKDFICELDLVV
jgi:hypothetical protein